jgi:hypothetical protein
MAEKRHMGFPLLTSVSRTGAHHIVQRAYLKGE